MKLGRQIMKLGDSSQETIYHSLGISCQSNNWDIVRPVVSNFIFLIILNRINRQVSISIQSI